MHPTNNFTQGKIFLPLLRFSVPILLALILQTAYGAVDLWMVGKFATAADVSAVSTGSQILNTITQVLVGLTTGTTVLLGQTLGQGRSDEAGTVIGNSIALFTVLAAALTLFTVGGANWIARITQVPPEAFSPTVAYIRMCGAGLCFITAYNVFGSIFRGLGDSKTPLLTVFIACVVNIAGDFILVAVAGLGALGAAIATVCAQGVSVMVSLLVVRRRGLPFALARKDITLRGRQVARILRLGSPVALQSGLVSVSFLVVMSIINSLGLVYSAGMGVAEKLCGFIMLVPSAFSQSVTTFVAQNVGGGAAGSGPAGAVAGHSGLPVLRRGHRISGLLPRGCTGAIVQPGSGDRGRGVGLSESLRHRHPADLLSLPLHRLFQRHGQDRLCHAPRTGGGLRDPHPPVLLHEQALPGVSVSGGSCHPLLHVGTDHFVRRILFPAARQGQTGSESAFTPCGGG